MRYHYIYWNGQIQKSDKPVTGKDEEQQDFSFIVSGLQNGRITLEAISYRVKFCYTT